MVLVINDVLLYEQTLHKLKIPDTKCVSFFTDISQGSWLFISPEADTLQQYSTKISSPNKMTNSALNDPTSHQ